MMGSYSTPFDRKIRKIKIENKKIKKQKNPKFIKKIKILDEIPTMEIVP